MGSMNRRARGLCSPAGRSLCPWLCVCAMKGSVHFELLYLGSTKEPRGANLDLLDWGEGCPGCPYSSLSSGGHVKSFIRK